LRNLLPKRSSSEMRCLYVMQFKAHEMVYEYEYNRLVVRSFEAR
jgi:hypothetical protein